MTHLAKTLSLDYKRSSEGYFTKYTAVPRLSRLVSESCERENAVRLSNVGSTLMNIAWKM